MNITSLSEVFIPQDFLFEGVHWFLEILLLVFLFMFLWICCCARSIRYFWKFPMPAAAGNAIAGRWRMRVQPPSMIVEAIEGRPGMTIVEIGCGSGLFTVAVAKAVQPGGMVYAVDIQEGMLDRLRERMKAEGVENITPILADAEGHVPLDDGIADALFSVAVLPEIPNPVAALAQFKRLLKDDGVWADSELLVDPDYPLQRTVIKWAREAGFVLDKKVGNAMRYVLVFKKG